MKAYNITAALLTGVLALSGVRAEEGALRLHIDAQQLGDALNQFAQQSGLQVVFFSEVGKGLKTPDISGSFTVEEALKRLLSNTALSYRFVDARTVAIGEKAAAVSAETVKLSQADTASTETPQILEKTKAETSKEISKPGIEEIIVTATKRTERLQDVPMSIAVIGNQDIERRGLIGMEDYLRSIPGVNQLDYGNGNNAIVIRGITTSPQNENTTVGSGATVSSYFGETPISASAGPYGGGIDVRPVDIERIEVLRGPQGTAFGDASLGGTLRLIPMKPKLDGFGAKVAAAYSSTSREGSDNSMIQGVINIPIVQNTFALRAVGFRYDESGIYRNTVGIDPAALARAQNGNPGPGSVGPWNILSDVQGYAPGDVGAMRSIGGRLAALWQPTESLELSATFLRQKVEQDGNPSANTTPYAQIAYPIAPQARVRGEKGDASDTDMDLINVVLNYDLGWAALTSAISKVDSGLVSAADLSAPFGRPFSLNTVNDFDSVAVETRLASKSSSRFQYLGGVFYQRFDSDAYSVAWSPGPPAPGYATNPGYIYDLTRKIDQRAVFGEVSYDLTDKLTATAGARYFKYGRDEVELRQGAVYGIPLGSPSVTPRSDDDDGSSFKANLDYKPTQDSMVYASWAQGFRLGRAQAGLAPFVSSCDLNGDGVLDGTGLSIASTTKIDSDSLDSYELGGKIAFFDRRIVTEIAVYHIEWKGLPVLATVTCPGALATRNYVANIGAATSDGIEFQASLFVTAGLKLDVGVGLIKAELAEDAPGLPGSPRKGARLPGSPKTSANLGAQYEFDISGYKAFVRADSFYAGRFYGDLLQTGFGVGDYIKVDARAGVAIKALSLEVFARNLTNDDAFTAGGPGATAPFSGYNLRPRTIGIQLGYNFE